MKVIVSNNHYFRLHTINQKELQTLELLRLELTIKVKNAFFSPKFKDGTWDGKKSFMSEKENRIMIGLLPICIKFLTTHDVIFDILDTRPNLPTFVNQPELEMFGLTLRDYQYEALIKALHYIKQADIYFPRGIIDIATNGGKNLVISGLIYCQGIPRTLVLIHRVEIINQCYEHLKSIFGSEVYLMTSKDKIPPKNAKLVLSLYKTMYNRVKSFVNFKKWANEIETLIVDEAHLAKGNEFSKLILNINAGSVYFLSGTPLAFNDIEQKIKTVGLSGPILIKVSNKDLIQKGVSLKPLIKIINYKPKSLNDELTTYAEVYENFIKLSKERNQLILDCVKKERKFTLISVLHTDHGLYLQQMFKNQGYKVYFLHGGSEDRDILFKAFKNGEIDTLITTMILKEGVNLPIIQRLILAHGGMSEITQKQLIGRLLRVNDDINEQVEVIDFNDDCEYLREHSKTRLKIYKAEGFEIKFE